MRTKTYIINQQPIPWSRARLNGKHFFDAQAKDKLVYGIYLQQQHDKEPIFTKACSIDATFYMMPPGNVLTKMKKAPAEIFYHTCKPDIDNLSKFLLDSISHGVLLIDDKIIYALNAKKVYDNNPRTEFTIKEI